MSNTSASEQVVIDDYDGHRVFRGCGYALLAELSVILFIAVLWWWLQ